MTNDALIYYSIIFAGIFVSAIASVGVAIFLSKYMSKKGKN